MFNCNLFTFKENAIQAKEIANIIEGQDIPIVIPSTASQFSTVLEPSSLRTSYDVQIVGIETTPGKQLCLEKSQHNDLAENLLLENQNLPTNVNVSFLIIFYVI